MVLEFVKDQPMFSRFGNPPEVMHASLTVSGCVHVCFPDFDLKSMSSIHKIPSRLNDTLMKF